MGKRISLPLGLIFKDTNSNIQSKLDCDSDLIFGVNMILFGLLHLDAQGMDISLNIGTDIPYQFHIGSTIDRKKLRVSLRSGILFGPYSQMTIGLIELLGTPEVYVNMLESAYQFYGR